jgi:hypothetical protein
MASTTSTCSGTHVAEFAWQLQKQLAAPATNAPVGASGVFTSPLSLYIALALALRGVWLVLVWTAATSTCSGQHRGAAHELRRLSMRASCRSKSRHHCVPHAACLQSCCRAVLELTSPTTPPTTTRTPLSLNVTRPRSAHNTLPPR